MKQVEFDDWETPFMRGDITISDIHWGDGSFEVWLGKTDKTYREKGNPLFKGIELQIHLAHLPTEKLYRIDYTNVNAFRFLDEHGLTQIWGERDRQNISITNSFKIRKHLWSEESPFSFIAGHPEEWSHLIATDNECFEVVCAVEPKVSFVKKIASVEGNQIEDD